MLCDKRTSSSSSAMLATIWLLLLATKLAGIGSERIMGEEVNDDFDFDGLPGAQHEFKVEVGGGVEECFYQRVARGALLHVSYEVLRGGDLNVDVVIRNSRYEVVEGYYWKPDGIMEYKAIEGDIYAVCVDNSFSRMTGKLVYLYIMTFVLADWDAYAKEFDDIANIAGNLTHSLSQVELSVQEMKRSQTQARFHVVKDYYLVTGNNRYVQNWSLAQCLVTLAASLAQVLALRRMFRTVDVTPGARKPRA